MKTTFSKSAVSTSVFVALWILVFSSSCIDDPPTHPEISNYASYLELVWELYDQKYVSFDSKNVDWDLVHDQYVEAAHSVESYSELLDITVEMLGNLEDRNAIIYASDIEIPTYAPDVEVNVCDSVLEDILWPYDFVWDSTGYCPGSWGYCVIDSIPYFAVGSFDYYFAITHFTTEFRNHLDSSAVIIDIRMADGTSLVPAGMIPSCFTSASMDGFLTQYRDGPEHDDLSPLSPHGISPRTWAFDKPVVLLMGEQNLGPAEVFASVMKRLPQVTIIGDTTGGGGNTPGYWDQRYWPIWTDTVWADTLWSSLTLTCPFARVFRADTTPIEGNGVIPDIYVQTTPADFLAGEDPVLQYALDYLSQ